MQEILSGMTEMALERLRQRLTDAEVRAVRAAIKYEVGSPDSMAWDDASIALMKMSDFVRDALAVQRAENKRIAEL